MIKCTDCKTTKYGIYYKHKRHVLCYNCIKNHPKVYKQFQENWSKGQLQMKVMPDIEGKKNG